MTNTPKIARTKAEKEAVRAKIEQLAAREKNDWEWLLGDERGRRILSKLLVKAGCFRTSFQPNALQMAFSEGNRNLGLYVLQKIQAYVPDRMADMINTRDADD